MIETEKSRARRDQEIIDQANRTGKFAPKPTVITAQSERKRKQSKHRQVAKALRKQVRQAIRRNKRQLRNRIPPLERFTKKS